MYDVIFRVSVEKHDAVARTKVVSPVRTILSIWPVTFVRASSMKGTWAVIKLMERRGMLAAISSESVSSDAESPSSPGSR